MPKLPRITAAKLLKVLLKASFFVHHQTGSHINLRHPHKTYLHVVVPYHKRELAPKTLQSILSQAEITIEEFLRLLKKA